MTTSRSDRMLPRAKPSVSRKYRWLGGALAVLVLLVVAGWLRARSFDADPSVPPLWKSANLPVSMPNGHRVKLGDLVRAGAPTVVSLWATWCGPCHKEAPAIADLRRRYGGTSLNIIYLNVRDEGASREDKADFLRSYGMAADSYAIMDEELITKLTNDTNVLIPRTLVFDSKGNLLASITGYKPLALSRIKGLVIA